ncbi:hypothetical protein BGW42_000929 [Actinomortierella wolfii]|nr:hypothetical protein BGW42_000929 [Actinomortierella wolfii]
MAMLRLPDEMLCYLLANLALTCKHLRRIVFDSHLRRHILLIRTPARLSSSLSHRPSRGELASQNILRGVHIQQHIRQGAYINGESFVRSYQVSCRLERQFLSQRISRKLKTRPSWLDLANRGLLPQEMFIREEDEEVRRKWAAYNHHHNHHHHHDYDYHQENLLGEAQQQLQMLTFEEEAGESKGEQEEVVHEVQAQQQMTADTQGNNEASMPSSSVNHQTKSPVPAPPPLPGFSSSSVSCSDATCPSTISHNNNSSSSSTADVVTSTTPSPRRRKNVSMVLIPKMERLRKAMERDRLSRLVQRRPSPAELQSSPKMAMILQTYHLVAYSSTSPALVPIAAHLHFLLKAERLRHWFHHSRPSLATMLNERHYLKTEPRTAWMVCPGVGPNVRFYEKLIQQSLKYRQQQEAYQASRKKF